jgi:hypothetical protein
VVRSPSIAMLPSVTCSEGKLTSRTGSILNPAHCSFVGLNVPGAGLAASEDCSATGLMSFGAMLRASPTRAAAAATIASCHRREERRRDRGATAPMGLAGVSRPTGVIQAPRALKSWSFQTGVPRAS